jgi:glycosyl transferase family 25
MVVRMEYREAIIIIETYIISIPTETKRFNFIKSQVELFSFLNFHFIDPVIGRHLSPDFLSKYYNDELSNEKLGRSLSLNEIGCALSHRKAWEQILKQNTSDYGLILEDDALISGNIYRMYKELIAFLNSLKDPFILLLTPSEYVSNKIFFKHEYLNIHPFYDGYYTTGYIINKSAIIKLLNAFPLITYPADVWNIYKHYVTIYSSVPYLVSISISETISSTINENKFNSLNKTIVIKKINFKYLQKLLYKIYKKIINKIYKNILSIKSTKLIF